MWSLLLCGECFSWVIPAKGHCPECLAVLRAEMPDPSLETLRETIGDLRVQLGYCRALRRGGDIPGSLYLTSGGLFFIPHRVEISSERLQPPSRKLLHSALEDTLVPLFRFLSWFRSSPRDRNSIEVRTFHPVLLLPEDTPLLPELLMANPGAFFLNRDRIQAFYHSRGRWTVDRTRGTDLVLLEDPEDPQFNDRILELRRSSDWLVPLTH